LFLITSALASQFYPYFFLTFARSLACFFFIKKKLGKRDKNKEGKRKKKLGRACFLFYIQTKNKLGSALALHPGGKGSEFYNFCLCFCKVKSKGKNQNKGQR
jgi:hypothetical protein